MARNRREPAKTGPGGTARWAAYLDWVRGEIAAAVLSLPEQQQLTPRVPSGWTPLEMLNHCLHMEQRWFVWGFLGERIENPWGDWNVDESWRGEDSDATRPEARWAVPAGVTASDLAERLHTIGAQTRDVLRRHALTTLAAPGGRFADSPPTLEWICFHVLAEYARHAGHLDIAVELAATEGAGAAGSPA
ncbi:MAG: DUF664 domain-containing protein [Nocardioides sp.]